MNGLGRPPLSLALFVAFVALPAQVLARTLRVPEDHATIAAAIETAAPGDEIAVAPGRYCGASITKGLTLVGAPGAVIIGCDDGPTLFRGLRVGFYFPGEAGRGVTGISVRGFVFDGAGVSNQNLAPLAFGIYGRFAHDVEVVANTFQGTVQAITNTGGDGWSIRGNRIAGLGVFDCNGPCGGGDGIVVQVATGPIAAEGGPADPRNRPERTLILGNVIEGTAPRGFARFPMAGIVMSSADANLIVANRISLAQQESAVRAVGVLVTDICCGEETPRRPGARFTGIFLNDGSASDRPIVIESEGRAEAPGLFMAGNLGVAGSR
jgi:hypothetical protein